MRRHSLLPRVHRRPGCVASVATVICASQNQNTSPPTCDKTKRQCHYRSRLLNTTVGASWPSRRKEVVLRLSLLPHESLIRCCTVWPWSVRVRILEHSNGSCRNLAYGCSPLSSIPHVLCRVTLDVSAHGRFYNTRLIRLAVWREIFVL